ncbi:MAG TPA: MFS transporter [Bryobacteraceae bacterium]|nr:MFS transporter [Bryobacteraceae bacterium]
MLGTISFTICFAAWGLISAFGPTFRAEFHLTAKAAAFLIAVPVLLGSLARIPMGMLTDRFGARRVFTPLFVFVAAAAVVVTWATTYQQLIGAAFLLGMAGSSFAIGIGYVSRWYPPERQGTALGVYGLGNIGQSAAVFLGPVLAKVIGRASVFHYVAVLLLVWAAVFALFAHDAPRRAPAAGFSAMLRVLATQRLSWALSAFYFLTFGGFVAFSIYLPSLLKDQFALTAADAGFRTAGFVILATLLRPVGGALSDRIGGARVLSGVFLGIAPFALLLSWNSMIPFTVGALGCAALLGFGNGAVFKLVPQYFPSNTATVTGLVGAMGGLGGFFPPLLLGVFRDAMGAVWPAFILLAATSVGLWKLNQRLFLTDEERTEARLSPEAIYRMERVRAGAWATLFTSLLVAAIVVGSRNLQNFDAALAIYTFAVIFATWGILYHYSVWLRKPPTRVFWRRGWELAKREGLLGSVAFLTKTAGTHLLAQTFIRRRSHLRWWMHQFLFWGCLLAVAITFPLVFGWMKFTSAPEDQMTYITYLFGFPVFSMPIRTVASGLLFHGLDISAVLVLTGISLALWRRMTDRGAMALQDFGDFLPLVLLFAISVTGLALTASTVWLRGAFYDFLAILHAIVVIGALLFLPFGKFFHIFQRPAQLGAKLYQRAGAQGDQAACERCGTSFASQMQIDDLNGVLPKLGFDYGMDGEVAYWQNLCPACKRKSMAAAQMRLKESAHAL